MAESQSTINEEGIIILPDNWAVCPDCLEKVNLGSAGIVNLTIHHRGSKKCKNGEKKRKAKSILRKRMTRRFQYILDFFLILHTQVLSAFFRISNPAVRI
ncbi:hypothetical protein CPB84DRAFT_1469524 [Gymnopilus junonius]|uniref:Uncharacterized protein n=1 Tax=Gymnopilus junonius TaxID=109634 RepID=A0A9P5NJ83_GYMJU|nr:hypothetical protein CPB84DRAFT_1469524 [Gymnopilus junonius]